MIVFRNTKVMFVFLYDSVISLFSFFVTYALLFNGNIALTKGIQVFLLVSQASLLFSFVANGLYRGMWRFSSLFDLLLVIRSCFLGIILSVVMNFFVTRMDSIPRTFPIVYFLVLVFALGGGRFCYRIFKDYYLNRLPKAQKNLSGGVTKVLIIGAGRAGEKLLRDIAATPSLNLHVLGFVDDDLSKKDRTIHNVKIYHGIESIPSLVEKLKIQKIFVAMPSASIEVIKKVATLGQLDGVEIKILPKMDHLLSSRVEISLLRNLNIEDLLGRDPVDLDLDELKQMIHRKTILVTGAAGSIGSELCMQIAKHRPKSIVMVDFSELLLYELEHKFKDTFPTVGHQPILQDVRNAVMMKSIFEKYQPHLVLHAAACKHVPIVENNPSEAVQTNVLGTKIVGELALEFNAERFVLISTDKSVNPTNIMGATKAIGEKVVSDLAKRSAQKGAITKFMSVRFGNVLGSNGSVVPLFRKQIENRKNLTVTHKDITRYFMSIQEACKLVLQAATMGMGSEIFVLDMGKPIKIVNLAKEMIRIAGLTLDRDIKIEYTGLRPGEKLYEELFDESEQIIKTSHPMVMKSSMQPVDENFLDNLENLVNAVNSGKSLEEYVHYIKRIVPGLQHPSLEQSVGFQQHGHTEISK